jgi:hypothetical protein
MLADSIEELAIAVPRSGDRRARTERARRPVRPAAYIRGPTAS